MTEILIILSGFLLSLISIFDFFEARYSPLGLIYACSSQSDWSCRSVLLSPWAQVWDHHPTAALASGFYLTLIWLTTLKQLRAIRYLISFACLASVFLIAIMKLKLNSICTLCLAMHAVNFSLLFFAFHKKSETETRKHKTGNFLILALSGLLTLGLGLITERSVFYSFQKSRHWIVESLTLPDWEDLISWEKPILTGPAFNLNFTVPVNFKKPFEMIAFIDIRCQYCRSTLPELIRTLAATGRNAKLLIYPFPMESSCNPDGALGFLDDHRGACLGAKIALCMARESNPDLSILSSVIETLFHHSDELITDHDESFLPYFKSFYSESVREKIHQCSLETTTQESLNKQIQVAIHAGVVMTPSFWIAGKKLEGAPTREQWLDFFKSIP